MISLKLYIYVGTTKLYDNKCACAGNIVCHSYVNLIMHSVPLSSFLQQIYILATNIYESLQRYNLTRKQKLNANNNFFMTI